MWNDPIVEEIRAVRTAHAKKFNFDLKAIAADLRKQQKVSKQAVVSLPSRKPTILLKIKVEDKK